MADRETCRLLLTRLKLDGWALGKTKVFLKYYHVEYLAKVYDHHIKRVIQVQACVRRWLARIRLEKSKNNGNTLSFASSGRNDIPYFVLDQANRANRPSTSRSRRWRPSCPRRRSSRTRQPSSSRRVSS